MGICQGKPLAAKCTDYSAGQEGYFNCNGKCSQAGSVWGSGPYTADSCACRAARHAGVIGASGGLFKVSKSAGRDNYAGSDRNGIASLAYGSYGSSIEIAKT